MNLLEIPVISSIVYSLLGIILCLMGYKFFDLATPFELSAEIEEGNVAAGVVVAGIFIAIAIVVGISIFPEFTISMG
jgi:uncharacterized membrane protein YjfL (UPF0719 family)